MSLPPGEDANGNSYLLALQNQISKLQHDCNLLRSSRKKFIVATLLSWLITLAVIYMYQTQKQNTDRVVAHIKSTLPTQAQLATPKPSLPSTTDIGTLDDAEIYLKKVKDALAGKQPSRQARKDKDLMTAQPGDPPASKRVLHSGNEKTDTGDTTRKDILRLIYQWEIAWELKDISAFFSYYSDQFNPGWRFKTVEAWKKRKAYLIDTPEWIKIEIDKIRIIDKTDATATVTFDQHYQKPGYSDFTRKRLQLAREGKQWKILRESGTTHNLDLENKN